MIPVSLTLRNFLSYGDEPQTLDFTTFRVACLSGDNGHGKSALLDAMTYALWGQARKGRHDRKPDEGLLRLGATHMAVDFTFDLGPERYRILRGYRRRPRSSISELELQVFDPDSDQFRPLTEAGAPSVTQQRIDDLLSMDYETFTNSAFLLQGQADAFTRKGPRERKQLLGRILGVERYDRLQALARQRLSDLEGHEHQLTLRIAEADTELAALQETTTRLGEATAALNHANLEMATAAAEQARQSERHARSQILKGEHNWDARLLDEVSQTLGKLAHEETELQQQAREDDRLLEAAVQIEADANERFERIEQLRHSEQRREQLRALQQELIGAEQQIQTARNDLQHNLARWQERQANARTTMDRCEQMLARSADIEAAWILVTQARDQLTRQREHRRAWEELANRRQQLQHEMSLERQKLEERLSHVLSQRADIDLQLDRRQELEEELAATEAALLVAQQQLETRHALGEAGARLRSQIEHRQQQQKERVDQLQRLEARRAQLDTSDAASCPLCGTDLDEEHRSHLHAEFAEQQETLRAQIETLDHELCQMHKDLAERRARYADLAAVEELAVSQQQLLASLHSRKQALRQSELLGQQLDTEVLALQGSIADESYGVASRQLLVATETAMEQIGYCPEQLEQAESQAANGEAEAQIQRLQDAQQQMDEARCLHDEASAQISTGQQRLSSVELAPAAFERRDHLSQQIAALNVDEEAHYRLVRRVQELEEAPLQLERLRVARQRREQGDTRLVALRQERSRQLAQQVELVRRQTERDEQMQQLAGVEEALARATEAVERYRQERDGLLERRGALRTRLEYLDSLTERNVTDQKERQQVQSQAWLHHQLVEAFGKDGIQALIIEHAIPEIEEEANSILRRLTDNRIQITIESVRDLKGGGSRETLDVKISDEIGERGYDMYSGGEAFRTDFALRLALSKVLARRSGTQLRTLIIDEGFGTQDQAGLEQLKESIHSICADFDKVLVVTHLEQIKNAFPVQIEVTKHPDRGSQFEIHHLA